MKIDRREFFGAAAAGASFAAVSRGAAAGPDDPLGVRNDFPVVGRSLYLNSAYIAPNPVQVAAAGREFADAKAIKPISLGEMQAKTDEVRRQYARLINATPEEVGFLFTTSEGENLVANALGLGAGDNVVLDELHYLAEFVLYEHLRATRGIEVRVVKARDGAVSARDFEPHTDRRTRLISVAWVSHQNGFRHDMRPLADLAHAHGALLYTDGVQAVGMFPIDVRAEDVDCMASGTYKWLLGSFGVAPFFVKRELLERIPNDRWGALHVQQELADRKFRIYESAKKYEYATLAFGPIYQLGAGLTYLETVGVQRIEAHTVALAHELRSGLVERGLRVLTPEGNRSSIVSFALTKDAAVTQKIFDEAGVQVTIRDRGTMVRVSPALFNNADDVRHFLELAPKLT
jgi:selenocysteine lyase/cysteine desulfurase